jgi:TolA-binding protein
MTHETENGLTSSGSDGVWASESDSLRRIVCPQGRILGFSWSVYSKGVSRWCAVVVHGALLLGLVFEARAEPERSGAASFVLGQAKARARMKRLYEVDEKRNEAISDLKKVIPGAEGMRKAEMIYRLAELYWEKAQFQNREALDAYEKRHEAWAKAGRPGTPPSLEAATQESERTKRLALKLYETVLERFPAYERNDEVLFYLGYNHQTRGELDAAVQAYLRLHDMFPESRFRGDTFLQLGEAYFDGRKLKDAKKAYEAARERANPQIAAYATYKLAWCEYNLEAYPAAIARLKEVVDLAEKTPAKDSIRLKSEALFDLARFFAHADDVDAAMDYYRSKLSGDELLRQGDRFAGFLYAQGSWEGGAKVSAMLLATAPNHPMAPSLQLRLVEAARRRGDDKVALLREVKALIKAYGPKSDWYGRLRVQAPEKAEAAKVRMESGLRELAVDYHRYAEKAKDKGAFGIAAALYTQYLDEFSDEPVAYEMRFFLAEIQSAVGQHRAAADGYERVARSDAQGKYAKQAALNAVLEWEIVVKEAKAPAAPRASATPREAPIPAEQLGLSRACDLYFSLADPSDTTLPEVKYKAAHIHYRYGHYSEAAKRFSEIVGRWPKNKLSARSVDLILASLSAQAKWPEVSQYAQQFLGQPELLEGDDKLRGRLEDAAAKAEYLQIQADETKAESTANAVAETWAGIAERFVTYAGRFRNTAYTDEALFSAAVLFRRAEQLDVSEAQYAEVVDRFPGTEAAKNALYARAGILAELHRMKEAAELYERFQDRYNSDGRALDAARNAALLWGRLDEKKRAAAVTKAYLAMPGVKDRATVNLRLCSLYEEMKDRKHALPCFKGFAKAFRSEAPIQRLHAMCRAGELSLELGRERSAQRSFGDVANGYKELPAAEKKSALARSCAATAALHRIEPDFRRYKKLSITLDGRSLKKKIASAESLACVASAGQPCAKRGAYPTVLDLQDARSGLEALVRMGEVYQDLAHAIRTSPIPKHLTEEQEDIYRGELDSFAQGPEEKAADAFEKALERGRDLRVYGQSMLEAESALSRLRPERFPERQRLPLWSMVPRHDLGAGRDAGHSDSMPFPQGQLILPTVKEQ